MKIPHCNLCGAPMTLVEGEQRLFECVLDTDKHGDAQQIRTALPGYRPRLESASDESSGD